MGTVAAHIADDHVGAVGLEAHTVLDLLVGVSWRNYLFSWRDSPSPLVTVEF